MPGHATACPHCWKTWEDSGRSPPSIFPWGRIIPERHCDGYSHRKGFLAKQLRSGGPLHLQHQNHALRHPAAGPHDCGLPFPEVLRMSEQLGHQVGIHCWDHVKWHDYLPRFTKEVTAKELMQAGSLFEQILGHKACSTAAPGWTVSPDSLAVQDSMGLSYCSDSRGTQPFYHGHEQQRFQYAADPDHPAHRRRDPRR